MKKINKIKNEYKEDKKSFLLKLLVAKAAIGFIGVLVVGPLLIGWFIMLAKFFLQSNLF